MTMFDDAIEWPNGLGFTPCSRAYADKMAERDRIFNAQYDSGSTDDLPPDDYNRWYRLNDELMQMQASGQHLGKSQRY